MDFTPVLWSIYTITEAKESHVPREKCYLSDPTRDKCYLYNSGVNIHALFRSRFTWEKKHAHMSLNMQSLGTALISIIIII